ncbi:MAG: VCBS repeat-containing protein [Verrucomicrobia bacterium]|nr:VCBS repeat-containing protein [Verrucomicrobiota bacterium]
MLLPPARSDASDRGLSRKRPGPGARRAALGGAALALLLPFASAAAPWETGPGYRRLALEVPPGGRPGFTTLPVPLTGVTFTNQLAQSRYLENFNLLNGSGVALGDFDGDGRCDVYLCGLERPGALYRNLGAFRFEDVADRVGADCAGQASTGAAFADVNGDGHLDLLVNSMGGPNALLVNDGRGRFTNLTAAAGLVSSLGSTSLALADIDGDGDLDLYVANYGVNSILRSGGHLSFRYVNGRPVATGRHAKRVRVLDGRIFELGEPDGLHLNDGSGRFTPIPGPAAPSWTRKAARWPTLPGTRASAFCSTTSTETARPTSTFAATPRPLTGSGSMTAAAASAPSPRWPFAKRRTSPCRCWPPTWTATATTTCW